MKIYKKVLSRNTGLWILCAWEDCERQGYELFKARVRETAPGVVPEKWIQYVFCSERHKMLWVNSHVKHGRMPAGYGGTT